METFDASTVVSNVGAISAGLIDLCSAVVPIVISVILASLVAAVIKRLTVWLVDVYDRRTGN